MQKPLKSVKSRAQKSFKTAALLLIAVVIGGSTLSGVKNVFAANPTCSTIEACRQQISQSQSAVASLKNQAYSYQDAINRLRLQMAALQESIDQNTAQQKAIEAEIIAKQAEIEHQRQVLGNVVKTMYVDDQMSTIEMLATSKNLSDYVDKEQYRSAVQTRIQAILIEIAELQKKLQIQKAEVDALIAQQQAQRAELAAAKAEQDQLLAYNKGQQAEYNAQTAANQNQLGALIEAQRRANSGPLNGDYYLIRFPGSVSDFDPGGYPWQNAGFSMSTAPGCGHPDPQTGQRDSYDSYGYCTRQCVSYAAWAVAASGRAAPRNLGSAKYWPGNVPASYLHTSGAQVGDVLITGMRTTWGHAMYVEQVSGSTVRVSEYNKHLDGEFQQSRWVTLD